MDKVTILKAIVIIIIAIIPLKAVQMITHSIDLQTVATMNVAQANSACESLPHLYEYENYE
jgi:hypothetical protein